MSTPLSSTKQDKTLGEHVTDTLNQKDRLEQLINNEGYRVRIFDNVSGEKIFGNNANDHINNPRTELENLKPPITEESESVKNLYALFDKLDADMKGHPDFQRLMQAFKDRQPPLPQTTIDQIEADLLGAYRFKVISNTQYYDDRALAERQKDFMQLANVCRRKGETVDSCEKTMINNEKKKFDTFLKEIINSSTKTDNYSDLIKTILNTKHYEYLGHETTEKIVKDIFVAKYGENSQEFTKFKNQFDVAKNFSDDMQKILENPNASFDVLIKEIYDNKNYQALSLENATQIAMKQVLALPFADTRRSQLLEELPQGPLNQFINSALDEFKIKLALKQDDPAALAKNFIDKMMNYEYYSTLDQQENNGAAKMLVAKINEMKDGLAKEALLTDLYRRAEDKIQKRLKEPQDPARTVTAIRADHICSVLDEKKINQLIAKKISELPSGQLPSKEQLIDEFNKNIVDPKDKLELPKSKFEQFTNTVGGFFKNIGSAIGSFFKKIGTAIMDVINPKTPETNSPKELSTPPPDSSSSRNDHSNLKSNAEVYAWLNDRYLRLTNSLSKTPENPILLDKKIELLDAFNDLFSKISKEHRNNEIPTAEFSKMTREILDITHNLLMQGTTDINSSPTLTNQSRVDQSSTSPTPPSPRK